MAGQENTPPLISKTFPFFDFYDQVASSDKLPGRIKGPRTCRFCGNKEGIVSFRKQGHAVSELLGKNDFLIFDECDTCNSFFSDYEGQLSLFFMPYFSVIGTPGKKGIRQFSSRLDENDTKKTTLKMGGQNNLNLDLGNLTDLQTDEDNKRITLTFRQEPISMLKVYKALVKIALSLLPEEDVETYRFLFNWLLDHRTNRVDVIPIAVVAPMKRVKWDKPGATLYKFKECKGLDDLEIYARYSLVIHFSNLMVQTYLLPARGLKPVSGKIPQGSIMLYPSFIQEYMPEKEKLAVADPTSLMEVHFDFRIYDLSKEEPQAKDEVMHLGYDNYKDIKK
jgi:hypothetical protein